MKCKHNRKQYGEKVCGHPSLKGRDIIISCVVDQLPDEATAHDYCKYFEK